MVTHLDAVHAQGCLTAVIEREGTYLMHLIMLVWNCGHCVMWCRYNKVILTRKKMYQAWHVLYWIWSIFYSACAPLCFWCKKKNENWNNDDTSNYIAFFHIKLWAMEDQPNLNTSCMARWSDFSPLDLARKQSKGDLVWDVCKVR